MSSEPHLGAAVELPWWVIPLGVPPALVAIAGLVLGAPLWAHALAVMTSLLLLAGLIWVALRVASTSMQSVWISVIYAIWFFTTITWAVTVATTPTCHCT